MVRVYYRGRLGDRLFQYCFGRIVASELEVNLEADPIPGFKNITSLRNRRRERLSLKNEQLLSGHEVDLPSILRDRHRRQIRVAGFFERYEYYQPYKAIIRNEWLHMETPYTLDEHEITIHVRSGDIWHQPRQHYVALPFSFYERILGKGQWTRVHVVTEDDTDPMVRKLARRFGAIVRSSTAIDDFAFLRASKNIILSVSTFSWWAAWLSHAKRIYCPLAGFFHPMIRQDIDLIVTDEDRYLYIPYEPPNVWKGTETQRLELLNS